MVVWMGEKVHTGSKGQEAAKVGAKKPSSSLVEKRKLR